MASKNKPIILIPGFSGTKLANINDLNFDIIYSAIQVSFETMEYLRLDKAGEHDEISQVIMERSDVEDAAYREIASLLRNKYKYQVYIFGYDWRKSCAESGKELEAFVKMLKRKLNVDSFNFLTHSQGGTVFECFVRELYREKDEHYPTINKAVITVPALKGLIKILMAIVMGESGDPFPLFVPKDLFRKILRTFPSVYELLPTYEGALLKDGENHPLTHKPDTWQSNLVEDDDDLVLTRLDDLRKFYAYKRRVFLNTLNEEARQKILILAGGGEPTKDLIRVEDRDTPVQINNFFNFEGLPDDEPGDGDGTIPIQSATAYHESVRTLVVQSRWYDKATHAFFLNDGRVQNIIKRYFDDDRGLWEGWWNDISGSIMEAKDYLEKKQR